MSTELDMLNDKLTHECFNFSATQQNQRLFFVFTYDVAWRESRAETLHLSQNIIC